MSNYREIYHRAMFSLKRAPDKAIRLLEQAIVLAEEEGDKRAVLHMQHWLLQELIFSKRDYKRAYELAIAAALEARKPMYADLQDHICIHEDLIFSYLGTDPIGNASMIEEAIAYMDTQITGSIPCRWCWHELKSSFYLAVGQLDKASTAAHEYLEISDRSVYRSHHGAIACSVLCQITYLQQHWDDLYAYAKRGEDLMGDNSSLAYHLAVLLASQVLALHHMGNRKEADRVYLKMVMRVERIDQDMLPIYYDMLCDYYRSLDNLEAALELRQKQLGEMAGKGQTYWESLCRIDQVRLLIDLGKSYIEEAQKAQQVIEMLKDPQPLLQELQNLSG